MLVQLASEFRGQMNTGKAIGIFERAFELGRASGDPRLQALARCGATYALSRGGRQEAAAKALAEARQLLASLEATPLDLRVACLQAGASLAGRTGHEDVALRDLEEARRLIERGGITHRSSYTRILTDIGGLYLEGGRMREALQMSELIEATHVRNGRGGTGTRVMAMQNRAVTLQNMGEVLEAARVREEVSKRLLALDPSQRRAYAFVVNLAVIENRLGASQRALDRLQGIPEQAGLEGNRSWELAARAAQIQALVDLDRLDEARKLVDAAAVEPGGVDPTPTAIRASIDQQDALIGLRRGDLAAARSAQQRLLAAATRSEAGERSVRSPVWVTLSEVALADGQLQDARRYAIRGLARAERDARGSETSANVGEALIRVARAELALGDVASARQHVQRAIRCFENGYGPAHRATQDARAWFEQIRAT
jgi:tetratricopeptide (TPR) repeat protein